MHVNMLWKFTFNH